MTLDSIYYFSIQDLRGALHVKFDDKKHLSLDHPRIFKGEVKPLKPISYHPLKGNRLNDFIEIGIPGMNLISCKIITQLKDHGITGWDIFPVKLYDKAGNEITGYEGFCVTGFCGSLQQENAPIIEKRMMKGGQ